MTAPVCASPPPIRGFVRARRRRARISLTALIDVVFILLVFFMLATSFLDERAIRMSTPAASLGGASLEGALLVELRRDGLRLSGQRVTMPHLLRRLQEHAARDAGQRVLIRPAPGVSLQEAVALLDSVSAAGLSDVSFVHHPAR